jgi:ketosteroid isomerase-like protein
MKYILLLILFCRISYAQENFSIDTYFDSYAKNFNDGNLSGLLSFYSPNFTGYYPGEPEQSYESVVQQFTKILSNKNLKASLSIEPVNSAIENRIAYAQVILRWSFKPSFADSPMLALDHGIILLEKDKSGSWKITSSSLMPVPTSN